jgi:hypothetical protein
MHARTIALLVALSAGTAAAQDPAKKPLYLHELTAQQALEYFSLHKKFATEKLLSHHEAWHRVNGPGGTGGPGSGREFLEFHRNQMMAEFEAFIRRNGKTIKEVPAWDPSKPVPDAFLKDPNPSFPKAQPQTFREPTWFRLRGGRTTDALFGAKKLGDFKTVDDLGRSLGTGKNGAMSHHARGHVEIAGTMNSFRSPKHPIFFPWHKHVDQIYAAWQTTPNGKPKPMMERMTRALFWSGPHGGDFAVEAMAAKIRAMPMAERERLGLEPLFPEAASRGVNGRADVARPYEVKLGVRDYARQTARGMAADAAQYVPAFLLKEGAKAVLAGDPQIAKDAVGTLATKEFWIGTGVMTLTMQGVNAGISKFASPRAGRVLGTIGLPMAVGMAAMHVVAGHGSLEQVALTTAAYSASGFLVNMSLGMFVQAALLPPVPRFALGVASLATSLLIGEKFEEWLFNAFGRKVAKHAGQGHDHGAATEGRQGVADMLNHVHDHMK